MQNEDILGETVIFFSKSFAIFETLGGLTGLLFAYMAYFYDHRTAIVIMIIVAGAVMFIYNGIRRYFNRAPQIIINTRGISTAKTAFKTWAQISKETVYTKVRGLNKGIYFSYEFEDGDAEIRINSLKISADKMEMLVSNPLYNINTSYKKYLTNKN